MSGAAPDDAAEREAFVCLAERWIRVGWQEGDAEALDALHAPGFIDHAAAGRRPDLEGFKQGVRELYAAFPDFYATIEDLVIETGTGTVTIRWTATGTHRGIFEGVPATNLKIHFRGIEILRMEQGRIRERWGEWNGLEVLAQLRERA
jgi:steroid delta-isomerase-like uncharacterized protein